MSRVTPFLIFYLFSFPVIGPATAGDNADMAQLVPEVWKHTIVETTCQELQDCCGVYRSCGDWYQRKPDPAPVPLPSSGLMLALGLAGLMTWRR